MPFGANVLLKCKTDKELKFADGIRLRPREASSAINVTPLQDEGGRSFALLFTNVVAPFDFVLEMTDTDNVVGLRHVVIKPVEDVPPEVDVQVEVIRKTHDGYLVTPRARIPFSGRVRDDHGLSSLEFLHTLTSLDSQAGIHATRVASAIQFVPRGSGGELLAPAYLTWLGTVIRSATDDSNKPPDRSAVAAFARRFKESASADPTPEEFKQKLQGKPESVLIRDHTFDPQDEKEGSFDVEKLGLKVTDDRQIQPRFRMRLWIVATDNNVENGPGIGQSKEKFVFLVVSENELLLEIAKVEEGLRVKLEDAVNKLKDARTKMERVVVELPALKPEEFSPMARRAEELVDTLTKSWDISREVYTDYQNILKELQVNRVDSRIIDKVERNICLPLNDAINQEFDRSDRSLRAFQKMLDEKKKEQPSVDQAKTELDQLIDRLTRILDSMGDLTTINKLIEQLTQIKREELDAYKTFKEMHDKLQDKLLDSALEGDKPPEKKP